MSKASKVHIICVLFSLILLACGNRENADNNRQISETATLPTPIGFQDLSSSTATSGSTQKEATLATSSDAPLHAAFNTQGDISELIALGFNLFDIAGSKSNPEDTIARINALPEQTQALVWLGNLGNAPSGKACPPPGFSDAEFKAIVDALANNPKVFGYNLADEPHPSKCPDAVDMLRVRSDYIHTIAPEQKVYITIQDGSNMCPEGEGCEYNALRPERTHVDLIGIDPYPCHFNDMGKAVKCDTSKISQRVQSAIDNGIPISAIVPIYQAFGQESRLDGKSTYYRMPTTQEFQDMYNIWKSLVPNPAFDFVYTWGIQCTESSCPAPQSLKNHPELQLLIKQYNSTP